MVKLLRNALKAQLVCDGILRKSKKMQVVILPPCRSRHVLCRRDFLMLQSKYVNSPYFNSTFTFGSIGSPFLGF